MKGISLDGLSKDELAAALAGLANTGQVELLWHTYLDEADLPAGTVPFSGISVSQVIRFIVERRFPSSS